MIELNNIINTNVTTLTQPVKDLNGVVVIEGGNTAYYADVCNKFTPMGLDGQLATRKQCATSAKLIDFVYSQEMDDYNLESYQSDAELIAKV